MNPQQVVNFMREKYPSNWNKSDYELYELSKEKFPTIPHEDENPFTPSVGDTAVTSDTSSYGEANDSPDFISNLLSSFNLNEAFAEEGYLGISPEFFKKSFNDSAAGLAYALRNGKFKYDVEDYDPNVWASIGSFATGLMNPVDLALFVGSGGVGAKIGGKLGNKFLAKEWAKKGIASNTSKHIKSDITREALFDAALESGFGLAAYSGAAGMLGEASKQSVEITSPDMAKTYFGEDAKQRDEFDEWGIVKTGASHAAEGLGLGMITGGTGFAIGRAWGKAIDKATNRGSKNKAALYKTLNLPSQIAVEGAQFTALPYVVHGGPKNMEQFQHDLIHNMGVITTLKGTTRLFKRTRDDIERMAKTGEKRIERELGPEWKESLKSELKETSQGERVARHAIEEANKIQGTKVRQDSNFAEFQDLMEGLIKSVDSFDNLTTKQQTTLATHGVNAINASIHFYENLRSKSYAEKLMGRNYTKEQWQAISKINEGTLEMYKQARDNYNNVKNYKTTQEQAAPGSQVGPTTTTPKGATKPYSELIMMKDNEIIRYGKSVYGNEFEAKYLDRNNPTGYNVAELTKDLGELYNQRTKGGPTDPPVEVPGERIFEKNVRREHQIQTDIFDKDFAPGGSKVRGDQIKSIWKEFQENILPSKTADKQALATNRAILEYIIAEELPLKRGGAGKYKGKRADFELESASITRLKQLNELSNFLAEKGLTFYDLNKKELRNFLVGKTEGHANAINFLKKEGNWLTIKDKPGLLEFINISDEAMTSLAYSPQIKVAGAMKSHIFLDNTENPLGLTNSINFAVGKTKNIINVPLTESMSQNLKAIMARNKRKNFEITNVDRDGNKYQLIFFDEQGKPIEQGHFNKIFKTKTIQSKDALGREWKGSETRKAFITWIGENYPKLTEMAQIAGLGHATAKDANKLLKVYQKYTPSQWIDYQAKQKEFINQIFGRYSKKQKKYVYGEIPLSQQVSGKGANYLSAFELQKIVKKIRAEGDYIRAGNQIIHKDTVLGMLQYKLETNLRGTDVFPNPSTLKTIRFTRKPFEIDKSLTQWKRKWQREPLDVADLPKALQEFAKRQAEINPGLEIVFQKNKKGEYAGYFDAVNGGIINLVLGKANQQTFFHENAHRFEAFIRDTKNKDMIKLWERGEKMFAKEAKKAGQTANEYFTDRVADFGTGMSKGVRSKMSNWGKLMITKLKQLLFGKKSLNQNDIKRLLGEKVYKGFSTANIVFSGEAGQRKFQINNPEQFIRKGKDTVKELISKKMKTPLDDVKSKDVNLVIESIAREAGILNPSEFREMFNSRSKYKNIPTEDLESFYNTINSANVQSIIGGKNFVDWVDQFSKINRDRKLANVTKDMEKAYLQTLLVKSGKIQDATAEQLKKYHSFIKEIGIKNTNENWIQRSIKEGSLDAESFAMVAQASKDLTLVLPVQVVLDRLGFKDLSNKLFSHASSEMNNIGKLVSSENNIAAIMATDGKMTNSKNITSIQLSKGQSKFDKIKDMLPAIMDQQRMAERYNLNKDPKSGYSLSKKQLALIDAIYDKKGSDPLKWGRREGTSASLIVKEFDKMNQAYKEEFKLVLREVLNDAQYESFMANNNIKWVSDGTYVSRQLTKEFLDVFKPNSKAFNNMVEADTKLLAEKMAKDNFKKAGKKNVSEKEMLEEIANVWDVARDQAEAGMNDRINFSNGKYQSTFLMKRHGKLPEFWETESGKLIKVYETSYDGTVKKYALGMSKMLANTEFFPEYVRLKGLTIPGVKGEMAKLKSQHKKWGTWIEDQIQSQLGIGSKPSLGGSLDTGLNAYANIIAKTHLSFPTSGLKNLLIGSYQTDAAQGPRQFFKGVVDSFNSEFRAEIRKGGHTEVGLRHIDTSINYIGPFLDKAFWFGAMRPTENINRYIAVRAAKGDLNTLAKTIRSSALKNSDRYNKAIIRLKEFYKLNDKDINLLKKYGMGGLDGNSTLKGINRTLEVRKLNQLYQKIDAAAHIYTQGATIGLFMPAWADKAGLKPLTLYKRMAYAATTNTINNGRIALKTGNGMNIVFGALGAGLSGQAMIGVYDYFLGQKPPHQNDSNWEKFLVRMWKGEFLGIISEWFNPDAGRGVFDATITPAVYNHWLTMFDALDSWRKGTKHGWQTVDDVLKGTFSVYNQSMKVIDRRMNSYNSGHIEFGNLYKEYEKKLKPDESKESLAISRTTKSPYFDDLKTAFNKGTPEELAKAYVRTFYAVANDYLQEGRTELDVEIRSYNEAFKEASKTLDRKMQALNPNKGTLFKKSKIGKRRSQAFLYKYLTKKQRERLFKLENEYNFKIRNFNKTLPKYLKQFNLKELGGDWDWK